MSEENTKKNLSKEIRNEQRKLLDNVIGSLGKLSVCMTECRTLSQSLSKVWVSHQW